MKKRHVSYFVLRSCAVLIAGLAVLTFFLSVIIVLYGIANFSSKRVFDAVNGYLMTLLAFMVGCLIIGIVGLSFLQHWQYWSLSAEAREKIRKPLDAFFTQWKRTRRIGTILYWTTTLLMGIAINTLVPSFVPDLILEDGAITRIEIQRMLNGELLIAMASVSLFAYGYYSWRYSLVTFEK